MDLPQPRPFGAEGRKSTDDFLSLYGHPQQDPRPSQGGCLKTHDFLQPLERRGKTSPREQSTLVTPAVEKPSPHVTPSSVEHFLPGGIGTYSISHISYISPRVPKPEGTLYTVPQSSSTERNEENSNCSSYTGSGFTLWEESAGKKGKTGKENLRERQVGRDSVAKVGQWTSERPSQSSSNHQNTLSSLSSSSKPITQRAQSFIEMIKSAKGSQEEEDDDEDFILKKENSPLKGDLTVKVDGKCTDQKANTPRSKHSATEQRRRSKINDRHKLRVLIPHSDQKRDKASFLLEVIEYIQFLQEKVHKYEGLFQGWSHEPSKLAAWRNGQGPVDIITDQTRAVDNGSNPAFLFATKLEENGICASPAYQRNAQPVESDMNNTTTFKAIEHGPGIKAASLPLNLQPNLFASVGIGKVGQLPTTLASESDDSASQPQAQPWQNRSCKMECSNVNDKLKEHDLAVEGGTISISSVYSQGLLNTLTQALQSSGVDLTQASISVQIDLGKRTNGSLTAPSSIKDHEVPNSNRVTPHAQVACQDFFQAQKRLKTSKS
ncbi:Myc-type, basic helix-loop-helix (bHLH) domain [Dillenia turbinata]|uniref:Myc-type, basic helix-loop-helix (BHLH) domain n=1 Tax=Dillenia turbinata TaxID=194707 RepID=A0AAN8V9F1_9MAGN